MARVFELNVLGPLTVTQVAKVTVLLRRIALVKPSTAELQALVSVIFVASMYGRCRRLGLQPSVNFR